MSYRSEPRATFRWKKCRDSETKFDRLDKSTRKEKVAQGPTHTRWTSDTNWTRANHFKGDQGMDIIYP